MPKVVRNKVYKADLGKSHYERFMCESGMDSFHGKDGFDAFSHYQALYLLVFSMYLKTNEKEI